MSGPIHVVTKGETLWGIAGKYLGDPTRWPELYELNNQPHVISVTNMRIVNPDLIFVGQKIAIPSKPANQAPQPKPSAKPVPTKQTLAYPKVRSIPFKYDLGDLPSITVASATHIATVSLKGSITLQSKDAIDFVTLTNAGAEITAKREADLAFSKLITDTQVGYDPKTNQISLEIGFTTQSDNRYLPTTRASAGISTKTGLPVVKGSIQAPELKGTIRNFAYLTQSVGIEIEITPKPPTARPIPIPVPVPSAKPLPRRNPTWDYLVGGALVVGAGILIVGTIVEDILTAGVGVADDAPSFAAAAAMFTGGMVLFKQVNGTTPIPIENANNQRQTF